MEEAITLRKKREFGEVYNATFMFLRQDYKLLGKALLIFVVPVIIFIAIISAYTQVSMAKSTETLIQNNPYDYLSRSIGYLLILVVLNLINQSMIVATVYGYLSLYLEKGRGNYGISHIMNKIKEHFFPVLLSRLLVLIIVLVGSLFCGFPGIYFAISLSMVGCALVLENKTIGDAISRSFSLTNLQWWWTFLILFVYGLMIFILYFLFVVVLGLINVGISLHSIKSSEMQLHSMHIVQAVYSIVITLVFSIIYIIPLLLIAFQYFNILEIKEKPSLQEKIDKLSNEQQ